MGPLQGARTALVSLLSCTYHAGGQAQACHAQRHRWPLPLCFSGICAHPPEQIAHRFHVADLLIDDLGVVSIVFPCIEQDRRPQHLQAHRHTNPLHIDVRPDEMPQVPWRVVLAGSRQKGVGRAELVVLSAPCRRLVHRGPRQEGKRPREAGVSGLPTGQAWARKQSWPAL